MPLRAKASSKPQKLYLVQETAAKLREKILACEPQTFIGSLPDLAKEMNVGIVTVQQAARVLEHEGLLSVRRGPSGGYYGMRPDEAALERAFAVYLRVHGFTTRESHEMLSVLDCEIMPAAARCKDEKLRTSMRALMERIDGCETAEERIAFERETRDLLFKMVARPLVELLCRVTSRLYAASPWGPLFVGKDGTALWKTSRRRLLTAIVERDEDLARFEAERYRRFVQTRLREIENGS